MLTTSKEGRAARACSIVFEDASTTGDPGSGPALTLRANRHTMSLVAEEIMPNPGCRGVKRLSQVMT